MYLHSSSAGPRERSKDKISPRSCSIQDKRQIEHFFVRYHSSLADNTTSSGEGEKKRSFNLKLRTGKRIFGTKLPPWTKSWYLLLLRFCESSEVGRISCRTPYKKEIPLFLTIIIHSQLIKSLPFSFKLSFLSTRHSYSNSIYINLIIINIF